MPVYVCYQLINHPSNYEGKEKYRGVFEIQKSGDKTSFGEIGLDIRTHASPKVGQDQVNELDIDETWQEWYTVVMVYYKLYLCSLRFIYILKQKLS